MLFSSCSLDYSTDAVKESSKPEFIFHDTSFSRIENCRTRAVLYADRIEQYSGEDSLYGKDLTFVVYDNDGSMAVTGSCGLFSADMNRGEYYFLDEVRLTGYSQDIRIEADNIKWNEKTEQLVSSGENPVRIYSGGFSGNGSAEGVTAEISGAGFSADGVTDQYQFTGGVSGTINISSTGGAE